MKQQIYTTELHKVSTHDKLQQEPVEFLFQELCGPWTLHILWRLGKSDILRFGELKTEVNGISARILTDRLRRLEKLGLVMRNRIASSPPQVNYQLSKRGRALFGIVEQFENFSQEHMSN